MNTILVAGASGFIGAALVTWLIGNGENIRGLDNLNPYYDTNLKNSRLKNIQTFLINAPGKRTFYKSELENESKPKHIFNTHCPSIVINLATQAGVRYSMLNSSAYIQSNLFGFSNLLEECQHYEVKNLIFASSGSVYGGNKNYLFVNLIL